MGNWALAQAQALLRIGIDLRVLSGTSWVPKALAFTPGAKAYASCPEHYVWDGLDVFYPRWLFYNFQILSHGLLKNPAPQIRLAWLSVKREMLKHVDQFQPDLIYAHHTQINGYIARQMQRHKGIPYIITDHEFGELAACSSNSRRHNFLYDTVRNSSRMVTVSQRMERTLLNAFPEAPSLTVHNGTVTLPGECLSTPRSAELSGKLIVFCAAALYERKGIPLLIKAFEAVARNRPELKLRIAGDGPDRAKVEEAISAAALPDQITLLGKILPTRVLQEMAHCDVFALPGWDEPFGVVFAEALSAGVPIIYASDAGISEIAQDRIHGLAVVPRSLESLIQALETLLSSENERLMMGKAARSLYEGALKWEHNAIKMRSIFEEALSQKMKPAHDQRM